MNIQGPRTDPEHRTDNVNYGRCGTAVNDMERPALPVLTKPLECDTVNTKLSLETEYEQVMVDSVKRRR